MRVVSLLIVVLLSCRGTNRENSQVHAAGPIDTAFKKEIPSGGYTYALDKSKEKQLGLEGIESGFDSLQIRLWVDYALSKRRELYIIKKNPQAIWSAVVYKMLVEKTLNSDSERIISKSIKTGRPKSGWDHLYSSLSRLKIETLPDMKDIPGWPITGTMEWIILLNLLPGIVTGTMDIICQNSFRTISGRQGI
jgi:hypothetical protein